MATHGNFCFFPWLVLPRPIRLGGFRFQPVALSGPDAPSAPDIMSIAEALLPRYVDLYGKPILRCTVVLRPRHARAWDIPELLWPKLQQASRTLALAVMAEQRFFEGHLSPHINATVFRPIAQGINPESPTSLAVLVRRRAQNLRIGGLELDDVLFQMPPEAIETSCPSPSDRFVRALERSRTAKADVWSAINESLPYFVIGHAETVALTDQACVMLSALAFERLLASADERSSASSIAGLYAELWSDHVRLALGKAKRIKADPPYRSEQVQWPAHRKWMKELYEARSAEVHGRVEQKFSRNWSAWQHVIIAAFAYPLAIKLRLQAAGFYSLSEQELGACDALDLLLDSDWGRDWRRPPEWSRILSMEEGHRALHRIIRSAIDAPTKGPIRGAG